MQRLMQWLNDFFAIKNNAGHHIIYIRRRYYQKSTDAEGNERYHQVYDCMNSGGLIDPYPVFEVNHPDIVSIFKITVKADPILRDETLSTNITHRTVETQTSKGEIFTEDIFLEKKRFCLSCFGILQN